MIRPENSKCNSFAILKIDDTNFTAVRCQKQGMKAAIKRIQKKSPNAIVWYQLEYHPNAIKFFNVVKSRLSGLANIKRNNIELTLGNEMQLREIMNEIENERIN